MGRVGLEPTTHGLKVCMRKAVLNLIRPVYPRLPMGRNGGAGRARTDDPRIMSPML